jgi:AcrR family transcriptional regulator
MTSTRSTDTRARLMEAGTRAFTEIGHDRVNLVRDILDPAGVGPGSFYRQFADKTDLLDAIISEVAVCRGTYILDVESETAEELVHEIFQRFLDSIEIADHAWDLHFRESGSTNPRLRERVRVGRALWIEHVVRLLGERAGIDDDVARRVGQWMVLVAAGFVETWFELTPDDRAAKRDIMRSDVLSGVDAGARRLLAGQRPRCSG